MKNVNGVHKVTINEMLEVIKKQEEVNPNTFVGVKMKTLFREVLQKTKDTKEVNPYYKEIFKVSNKTYRLVTNYEKRVKGNLEKEGKDPNTFVVDPLKGKKHISKSLLTDTETETKFYVMVEWFPEIKGTTTYEYQGNSIDKSLFEKWISNRDSSNEKQGLEREVKPITPELSNILEMSIGGERYEIVKG
jgi:hypothetical protein